MKTFLKCALIVLLGAVVGFVNGFLGAGGGILAVLVFKYVCKLDDKTAHSTAVLTILPMCLCASFMYFFSGAIKFSVALPVLIGSLAGGVVGTFLLKKLKVDVVNIIFIALTIFAGVKMVI